MHMVGEVSNMFGAHLKLLMARDLYRNSSQHIVVC